MPSSSSDTADTAKENQQDGVNVKPRGKLCVSIDRDNASDDPDGQDPEVKTETQKYKKRVSIDRTSRKPEIKVAAFSAEDPEIWFALLEGQFRSHHITDDDCMYNAVVTNLDVHNAKVVKDVILNPPPRFRYRKVKTELIRRLTVSADKKIEQLLNRETLGDRKPSEFLRHLQDLGGPTVPDDFLRSVWINRLPNSIRAILASQPSYSLEELADLADRINEITIPSVAATSARAPSGSAPSSEIAELRHMVERLTAKLDEHTRASQRSSDRSRPQQRRGRSSARSRTRSASSYRKYPICWYHEKFGAKAHKCISPCDYKAENSAGSR